MWSVRSEKGNTLSVRTALRASPCRMLSRLHVRVVLGYIAQYSSDWRVMRTRTATMLGGTLDGQIGQRTGHTYDPWVGDVGLGPAANTYNYNTY